jgi:hypothetical protein
MDIRNNSEESIPRRIQTETDDPLLPLNSLIAEIDRETGVTVSPKPPNETDSRKPEGAGDRLQHQFILQRPGNWPPARHYTSAQSAQLDNGYQ